MTHSRNAPPAGLIRVGAGYANQASVAGASLGFLIVTALLEAHPACVVERFFLPDRRLPLPPRSVRLQPSGDALSSAHLLFLSLSYEGDAVHVPAMLEAGGLPALARDRAPGHPLLVGGGALTMINPEPVAAFFDVILVGEAEALLGAFLKQWESWRSRSRSGLLAALDELPGALVPARRGHLTWAVERGGLVPGPTVFLDGASGGDPLSATDSRPADRHVITRSSREVKSSASVARMEAASGGPTVLLELGRGCPRRCRFCAAGRIYSPLRDCPAELLLERARGEVRTGDVVGLMSLSAGDHPELEVLTRGLLGMGARISLASLPATFRREAVLRDLIASGARTLTIAPETGSDGLRRAIGKPMTNDQILRAVRQMGAAGLERLRTYFILGLPGETEDDRRAIVRLLTALRAQMPRGTHLSATLNAFVPKPRTPFQWAPMAALKELKEAARGVRATMPRGIQVRIKSLREARDQALLARGDVHWAERLIRMAQSGASATARLRAEGVDAGAMTGLLQDRGPLPWDYLIDARQRAGLWKEWIESRPRELE